MTSELDAERDQFRAHVAESERLFSAGDADAGNAEIGELERLVKQWKAEGRLVDALSPLLGAPEPPAVRFNASASLLGAGHPEAALAALETLEREQLGTASLDAGVLIKSWRRREDREA